jgi:hypothetical protein
MSLSSAPREPDSGRNTSDEHSPGDQELAYPWEELRKRPSALRRWGKRVAKALLAGLVLLACREWYRHYQAQKTLDEALAELDRTDPGWRLADIEAARAVVPDDENGAACVAAAADRLPPVWPHLEDIPDLDAIEGPDRVSAKAAAWLRDSFGTMKAARTEALKLADRPRGRHPLVHAKMFIDTLLPSQSKVPIVRNLLSQEVLFCADAGDLSGATRACRAVLNAGRSLGDEPLIVSQIFRTTAAVEACRLVEWMLSQGEAQPAGLAVLQEALADEAKHLELRLSYRGERAGLHELFAAVEQGEVTMSEVAGGQPTLQDTLLGWHIRYKIRAAHPVLLAFMTRVVATADLPYHEQEAAEQELLTDLRKPNRENGVLLVMVPAFQKMGAASRHKQAWLRSTVVALASERYRRTKGAWPAALANLVPEYLGAVPTDPYDGMPLRYQRLADGVVIYSVGSDRKDDGGDLDRTDKPPPGSDVGCRLWDVAQRHRTPRPAAAGPAR